MEWSFGYCETGPGVYRCHPRANASHEYRESVPMGGTMLSEQQVHDLLDDLRKEWIGSTYNLLQKNCCHFSHTFCQGLGAGPTPTWIMHLAGVGTTLLEGVDQAAATAQAVANMAAAIDDRWEIMSTTESFLSREVEIDERVIESVESAARNLWSKAFGAVSVNKCK